MEIRILGDEEIKEAKVGHVAILVNGKPVVVDGDRAVVKEALKDALGQVVEWGEEYCREHSNDMWHRRECPQCWQELKKQAEEKEATNGL